MLISLTWALLHHLTQLSEPGSVPSSKRRRSLAVGPRAQSWLQWQAKGALLAYPSGVWQRGRDRRQPVDQRCCASYADSNSNRDYGVLDPRQHRCRSEVDGRGSRVPYTPPGITAAGSPIAQRDRPEMQFASCRLGFFHQGIRHRELVPRDSCLRCHIAGLYLSKVPFRGTLP